MEQIFILTTDHRNILILNDIITSPEADVMVTGYKKKKSIFSPLSLLIYNSGDCFKTA